MKWLTLLALVVLAMPAQGQPAPVPPPVILHVFSNDGTPTFAIEGEAGTNGPILHAGGVLVVRASDGLEALVVVAPSTNAGSLPGTVGPNATTARPGFPGALQTPSRGEYAASPTYHQVSVLVCTSFAALPQDSPEWVRPTCETWRALRHADAPTGDPGFTLEVNYGVGVYAPAPPSIPDPPLEPDDPRN
jgi:hypothetical protein